MPKYVITIQQVVDVEAKNKKQARCLVKDKSPYRSFSGYGVNGHYEVETHPLIKIISCVEKRSKKNA